MNIVLLVCSLLLPTFLYPTVHVVGDSHSFFSFTNQHKESSFTYLQEDQQAVEMSIHWIGPRTMYRFGQDTLSIVNMQQLGVTQDDTIVFVFGEIDVRCHIGKQRDLQNVTLADIINPLVAHYLDAIEENCALCKPLHCVVCGVVPPTDQDFDANYPRYGSLQDRIAIAQALNSALRQEAVQRGMFFLDIYTPFATARGDLNKAVSDGRVHIAIEHNKPVKDALCALLRWN